MPKRNWTFDDYVTKLRNRDACDAALSWIGAQRFEKNSTPSDIWNRCTRAEWMLWAMDLEIPTKRFVDDLFNFHLRRCHPDERYLECWVYNLIDERVISKVEREAIREADRLRMEDVSLDDAQIPRANYSVASTILYSNAQLFWFPDVMSDIIDHYNTEGDRAKLAAIIRRHYPWRVAKHYIMDHQ